MKKMLWKRPLACAILWAVGLTAAAQTPAQTPAPPPQAAAPPPNTVVKLSHWALLGLVNPAVELRLNGHMSLQLEGLGSFYRKDFLGTGNPMMMGNGFLDLRYYFEEALRGLYLGPNVGYGVWKLNRNLTPGYHSADEDIKTTYSVGCNVMGGLTMGWQFVFGRHSRWGLDMNYTLGGHKAWFQAFRKADDMPKAHGKKTTGGFLPAYKGGFFLTYRF